MTTKSSLAIEPGCIICQDTTLIGNIRVGSGSIIHPRASIINEKPEATIIIAVLGDNNIIEEQVVIHNISNSTLVIGNNNIFEVGAVVRDALAIGDNNIIEPKCIIGSGCIINNNCILTSPVILPSNTIVKDKHIVTSIDKTLQIKQQTTEVFSSVHNKYLEILAKNMPSFHHIRK